MSKINFYTIKPEIADWIEKHGLSKTESKLFWYLIKLDPFGDRPIKLKIAAILLATGIGKTAYHAAIAKFEGLGWFDFKYTDVIFSNLACKKSGETVRKNEQQFDIPNSQFGISEKRSPKQPARADDFVSQTSSDLIQTNSDQLEDFSNFSDSENSEKLQGLTAIAQIAIASSKPDTEIESLETSEASNKKRLPDISDIPIEGDSFRRRVEDFVLKEMKFSPRDRTAYFSKFSPQHWQDWESKYKAQFSPSPVAHKAFIPEIVEVAPPDSEAVQDALAQIRKSLGIKVAK